MGPVSPTIGRFASIFIEENLGSAVDAVCQALIKHGQQTLPELLRATRLPGATLRAALLALLQHNLAEAFLLRPEPGLRAAPPAQHIYEANAGSIAQWLRKPHVLELLHRDFGGERDAESRGSVPFAIVEALLCNGRLRLDQVAGAVAERQNRAREDVAEAVEAALVLLVKERLLERAPPCDLPPRTPPSFAKPKKGAGKAGSPSGPVDDAEAAKQLARKQYQGVRFALPPDIRGALAAAPAQKKRKRDAGEAAAAQALPTAPLWRVNMEEVNHRLREEACAEHAAGVWGRDARIVMPALMRAARQHSSSATPGAQPVFAAQVAAAAKQRAKLHPEQTPMTPAQVAACLSELAEDEASAVTRASGEAFAIDVRAATLALRQKHTEAIVRERFPPIGMRLFRLLRAKRQLEQKAVAEAAMVPVRDAREMLYRLLRAGFVALQDVPKTADHAASRTFHTWRVDDAAVHARVAAEVALAACNLRARLQHEYRQHAEELRQMDADGGASLTDEERRRLMRMAQACEVLDARMLALDPLLALFWDASS